MMLSKSQQDPFRFLKRKKTGSSAAKVCQPAIANQVLPAYLTEMAESRIEETSQHHFTHYDPMKYFSRAC